MDSGCFESYKIDYTSVSILGFSPDELRQDFDQRNNEKSEFVAAGRFRTGGVKFHAPRDFIKPNTTASSARRKSGNANGRKLCKASASCTLNGKKQPQFQPGWSFGEAQPRDFVHLDH